MLPNGSFLAAAGPLVAVGSLASVDAGLSVVDGVLDDTLVEGDALEDGALDGDVPEDDVPEDPVFGVGVGDDEAAAGVALEVPLPLPRRRERPFLDESFGGGDVVAPAGERLSASLAGGGVVADAAVASGLTLSLDASADVFCTSSCSFGCLLICR
ncbi:hypothetical protein ACT3OH_12035 [Vreelandella zhanjiangensis]|uniref:hypothetical protein n=1 Tax=Vreelandella zhanjiangensis TaxID=1121960 RepID=UPI00402A8944